MAPHCLESSGENNKQTPSLLVVAFDLILSHNYLFVSLSLSLSPNNEQVCMLSLPLSRIFIPFAAIFSLGSGYTRIVMFDVLNWHFLLFFYCVCRVKAILGV